MNKDINAIGIVKQMVADGQISQEVAEKYFPELAESEDERIRKEIIDFATKANNGATSILANNYNFNKWIVWLGKQGEQKFEQKFFINDKVVHKATGKIWTIHYYLKDTNSYYVEDNDGLLHHYRESELKLVEQKSAEWSEEDENHIKSILSTIEYCKAQFPNAQSVVEAYNADINWLKSFKNRYTWKPSDEQIKVCKEVYADILSAKGFDLGTVNSELNRMEEQLKKIMEE